MSASVGDKDWIAVPVKNKTEATWNSNFLPILVSPKSTNIPLESIAPRREELAICPKDNADNVPNSDAPLPRIRTTDEEQPISDPNNNPPNAAVLKGATQGGIPLLGTSTRASSSTVLT